MRAEGFSRYLAKTYRHKTDTFRLRELEGTSQRSHNQKGLRAEVSLSTVWLPVHYTSHWPNILHHLENKKHTLLLPYLASSHMEQRKLRM